MTIKIFGCGGAGISVAARYAKTGYFAEDVELLGLDTSDANVSKDPGFKVEFVPGTQGSGSDQSLNADKYEPFLKRVLAQSGKGDINVIIYSGGGGTGSSMGPTLHQMLVSEEIPTLSIVIGDKASINEATNTVRALINLTSYASDGNPIVYSYFDNGSGKTHGDVNTEVCSFIDIFKLVFDNSNHFIDQTDIKHFFFYTKVVKATPVLSCLEFVREDDAPGYTRNVVSAISLYASQDTINQTFQQLLYRKAGVISDDLVDVFASSLPIHAVLDHGDSVEKVKAMLDTQRKRNTEVNEMYATTTSIPELNQPAKQKGFVKYDI